ncbi:hypothetical protein [Asaia lannensis]
MPYGRIPAWLRPVSPARESWPLTTPVRMINPSRQPKQPSGMVDRTGKPGQPIEAAG